MSTLDEEEDLTSLLGRHPKGESRAEDRRKRELRSISSADRRELRAKETKSVQLGVRVRPSIKSKAVSLAFAEGISTADLIEKAIEQYSMRGQA